MSDLSQLKTLANMLRPLGEMISLVEKAESAEQAVRSAKAQLAKMDAEREKIQSDIAESVAKFERVNREADERERLAAKACETMLAESKAKVDAEVARLSEFATAQRVKADDIVSTATNRAKTIDASIAEKLKEEARLEGKIAKLKTDLRRLLASAEQ